MKRAGTRKMFFFYLALSSSSYSFSLEENRMTVKLASG